jgi:two-component system response regulator PilR (NtrC family)
MNLEWPGNVRELENLVERVLLLSDNDILTEEDIKPEIAQKAEPQPEKGIDLSEGIDLEEKLSSIECEYLCAALKTTNGNKTEAAKLLGLKFRAFRHKLSKYDIKGLNDATQEE